MQTIAANLPSRNLPNVKVCDERVAIALHGAANLVRRIGRLRRGDQAECRSWPAEGHKPMRKLPRCLQARPPDRAMTSQRTPGEQGTNRRERRDCIREDMEISRAQVQIMVMRVAIIPVSMFVMMRMADIEKQRANQVDHRSDGVRRWLRRNESATEERTDAQIHRHEEGNHREHDRARKTT